MPATKLARRLLPTPERLRHTAGLRWLGRHLHERPWLWVAHRRKVALGAALGLGLGVIPLPSQMLMAALAAMLLRANVAAAVAATWLTNPFTLVPIWTLAIALGDLVLPGAAAVAEAVPVLELSWTQPATWAAGLTHWVASLGLSLLVGLPLAGVLLGAALYTLVYWAWWGLVMRERRRRLARRRSRCGLD